jgi:hypothetical protein
MRGLIPVALAVGVLAGCGGSAGGASGGAASIVPGSAVAFAAIDTHLDASEWQAVDVLLQRFPVQDPVLAQLRSLQLGGEVDLAALGGSLVVLTHSSDAKLAQAFVSKRIAGWTAFAHEAATLDALGGDTTLASTHAYQAATAGVPAGAVARAYASSAAAQELLGALPGQEQVVRTSTARRRLVPANQVHQAVVPEKYTWAVAAVVPSSHGPELEAHARVLPPPASLLEVSPFTQAPVPAYPARLVDEIPADVLAVADFQVTSGAFELADPATFPAVLRDAMASSSNLLNQLDTILGGETAVYVRAAEPKPEVTLVTQPADTNAATQDIETALQGVPALSGIRPHVAVLGGELVVSTTEEGIAAFRGAGTKLSGDATFAYTIRRAGFPARATGFVYANLQHGTAALATLAPLFGAPVPKTPEKAMLLFSNRVGRDASSILFLLDR